jgi:hypothetical protein
MRAIIIAEKRLVELFELTASRIRSSTPNPGHDESGVSLRTVNFHLEELKREIRDGEA